MNTDKNQAFYAFEMTRLPAAVYAALGAALTYYGLQPLYTRAPGILGDAILVCGLLLLTLLSACRAAASCLQNKRRWRKREVYAAFFAAGAILGLACRAQAHRQAALSLGLHAVTAISGRLLDDPRAFSGAGSAEEERGMGTVLLTQTENAAGTRASARGQVSVFFPEGAVSRLKSFGRGSRVYITGQFAESARGGQIFRAESVHVVSSSPKIEQFRTSAREAVTRVFTGKNEKTWGGLALALLLGVKDNLNSNLSAQYREAGCSYILALSGMHLAIVSAVIAFLLRKPLGLKGASVFGAVFITLYVALVGALPSLERAAIMYLVGVSAILLSVKTRPLVTLSLAFLLQITWQPASGDSISFMLSYMALAGILTIGQASGDLLRGWVPQTIASPLSASLGAFLATAGITAVFFGELRFAGIICGLVMVPLTTAFMIGAIIYLCLSPLLFLRPLLSFPMSLLYKILDFASSIAAKLPGFQVTNPAPFVVISILLCAGLCVVWYFVTKKRRLVPAFAVPASLTRVVRITA